MNVGDMVRINQCEQCPSIVDKVVRIKKLVPLGSDPVGGLILNFGRGRPPRNCPETISQNDVSLVEG